MKHACSLIAAPLAAITLALCLGSRAPVKAAEPPPSWQSKDIGKPGAAGRLAGSGDSVDLFGSGADIWGSADACQYASVLWQGDVEIVAAVLSVDKTDPWAKAGLMLRNALDDASPHVMLAITPEKGVTLIRRSSAGAPSEDDAYQAMRLVSVGGKQTYQQRGSGGVDSAKDSITGAAFPHWLKLIKQGAIVTAYHSSDGQQWVWLGTVQHDFDKQFYVGLAVTSHDDTQICRARFSGIQVLIPSGSPAAAAAQGAGDGLVGSYFSTRDQSGPATCRIDPVVLFDWGLAAPMPNVGPYWWSARWDGELQAQYTEPYALQVVSDDRARVWLDGKLLIDEWYDHAASVSSAMVNLEAGKHYALRVDYFQNRGGAMVKLLWSSRSTPQQIIPQSQLYSKTSVMPPQDLQQMYQAELAPQPGTASSEGCPPGWSRADVGLVGVEGQVQVSNGSWAVSGAGADIWANEDGCCFVFQPLAGDGQITARVLSEQDTDPWAKAGLIIRDGLGADARHMMLAVTPEHGLGCLYRPEPADETTLDDGGAFSGPVWLRLVRSGSQISAFQSSDGTNWVWVASEQFDSLSNALVGLAVSSHDNSTPGTATFDQVTVESVAQGPGAQPALGTGNGLNATYFDGNTGAIVSQLDPQVNFDWDFGSPAGAGQNSNN